MILLDTSALAKLLVEEDESPRLRIALSLGSAAGQDFAISTLATVELRRLAIRLGIDQPRIEAITRPFRVLRLTEGILQLAARIPHPHLGTLDAIHIATALAAEASELWTYDLRQMQAAQAEGLLTRQP